MSMVFNRIKNLSSINRIILYLGSGLLVFVVLITSLMGLLWHPSQSVAPQHTGTDLSHMPLSPLLFGTNLNMTDGRDQVLTSAATRDVLQQIHPQSIRIPLRSNVSPAIVLQAAQIVKSLGATPMVTLQGALDNDALADDTKIVQIMNQVFGNSVVYYEYGNEDDLVGLSAERYTRSWNALVPLLKPLAPKGQFIGPVTYRYDQQFLTTFLRGAQPRPNGISWHEYTCVKADPRETCLSHLNAWNTHISDARDLMAKSIGTPLPILISEWNYAPDASTSDGKSTDTAFMSTWTQKAFQTLVNNRVFASMQYSATNTPAPLVSTSNDLTTQGAVFMSQYQHAVAQTNIPSSGSPTASGTSLPTVTPTVTPSPTPDPLPTVVARATSVSQPTVVSQPTIVPTPPGVSTPVKTPEKVSTPVALTTPTIVQPTEVATPEPTIDVMAAAIAENKTPLYRLYSSKYANHFYTISVKDRDDAVNNNSYTYEGIAAYVLKKQIAGSVPLYWLYDVPIGDDFYTTSADERDNAVSKLGYQSQGIAGYVFTSKVKKSIPFYRLYSSGQGDHFYTTSAGDRDKASADLGYQYEGIACYVFGS